MSDSKHKGMVTASINDDAIVTDSKTVRSVTRIAQSFCEPQRLATHKERDELSEDSSPYGWIKAPEVASRILRENEPHTSHAELLADIFQRDDFALRGLSTSVRDPPEILRRR